MHHPLQRHKILVDREARNGYFVKELVIAQKHELGSTYNTHRLF